MTNSVLVNKVVCAWPWHCVQPGDISVRLDGTWLEFCDRHAMRAHLAWAVTGDARPVMPVAVGA